MKITFNGKKVELKYSFRILFYWEKVMAENEAEKTSVYAEYLLCYCSFVYSSDEMSDVTFDQFMDEVDKNPAIYPMWKEWYNKETEDKKKAMEMAMTK